MNERIQELEKQSYTEAQHEMGGTYKAFDKEKFAELIVQECLMKVIGAKIRGESIDTLIQNIKEDFGVKE
jgi:HEPN domain-containing protein